MTASALSSLYISDALSYIYFMLVGHIYTNTKIDSTFICTFWYSEYEIQYVFQQIWFLERWNDINNAALKLNKWGSDFNSHTFHIHALIAVICHYFQ